MSALVDTTLRPERPDYASFGGPVTFLGTGIDNDGAPWDLSEWRAKTTLVPGNANGAVGTPQYEFASGSQFGTLSCTNCSQPVFTATRKSSYCNVYDVVIRTNYGGLLSDPFYIWINAPHSTVVANDVDGGVWNYTYAFHDGYESRINYITNDLCGNDFWDYHINESFNSVPWVTQYSNSNWLAGPAEGWSVLFPGQWRDAVNFYSSNCASQPCVPIPLNPSGDFTPVHYTTQSWAVGSSTPGQGAKIQTNVLRRYRDEAWHDNPIVNPAVP